MKIEKFKNFFKKKKHQNIENQATVNYKFVIGDYVKLNDEYIKSVHDEFNYFIGHIFKIVSKFNFGGTAGKDYNNYYGVLDLDTDAYKTIYEIHLDLVPEEEVHAKKYNL